MNQPASEIIFPVTPVAGDKGGELCVFRYESGSMKLRVPQKRGRPRGSTKKTKSSKYETNDNIQGDFDFVNVTTGQLDVDRDTRKRIRKRVMVNHMRLRQTKRQELNEHTCLPATRTSSIDPFDVFPIRLEPYMLDLLKFYITAGWKAFYSIEKYAGFNPLSEYWLPLAFQDAAFLHTLIGCADCHIIEETCSRIRDRPRAVKHLNAAISTVSQRIKDAKLVTDETLLVIATIAIIEKSRGAHDHWQLHMEGLRRLVGLRGGISCLESKPLLMGKLHRADLYGSTDAVQTPYFCGRYFLIPSATSSNKVKREGFQRLNHHITIDETLKCCISTLSDIMHSMRRLKNRKGDRVGAAQVRFWFTATQYTLLSANYHDSQIFENIIRLALTLFSTVLTTEPHTQGPLCDMLIAKIKSLWERECFQPLPTDFSLWTVFLACCLVWDDQLKEWCFSILRATTNDVGIHTWEDLSQVLGTFLWDPELLDFQGQDIWNNISDQ